MEDWAISGGLRKELSNGLEHFLIGERFFQRKVGSYQLCGMQIVLRFGSASAQAVILFVITAALVAAKRRVER